jgi:AmmeMemoRadiSam system protein B
MDHLEKPRIRPVEAFPVEQNGTTFVCLRDPSGLAPETLMLGMGAYFIATLMSGEHDLRDIQAAFLQRFGEMIPLEKIKELVAALDQNYFLFSPAFAERERALREAFLSSPERPAHLAGFCYETDPAKLREELAAYFDPPEGPGRAPARKRDATLAGLVAPHIDPRRGRAAYAHAYGELIAHEPPELVVILGTSHYGPGPELFTATSKSYATPLGAVETDREFTERLAERYRAAGDLFAQEVLHRDEHSIEFQALFLAWALGTRGYQIVPVLVSSFHELVQAGETPGNNPRVRSFVDALGEMLAAERRRTLIIAGVDFAHVGRKFGDAFDADEAVAARVQREDLKLIENIKRGDPEGFFADIARDRDSRRICGLAPLYTQLALRRGRRGRLLKYGIAMEPDTGSAVSFASLAIE